MNFIKDIYVHDVVMHMKFRRMSLVIGELLPFEYLNLIELFNHQTLLSKQQMDCFETYTDYNVVVHVKFRQDVISSR